MAQPPNSKEIEKASRERAIFVEFSKVAMLEVETASVVSERPPKPDISCLIGGLLHYFELAEITDEEYARDCGLHMNDVEIYGGRLSHHEPLLYVFRAKAIKRYDSLNGPLELLVYYDKQVAPYFDLSFIPANIGSIANTMLISGGWNRIWAFDTWKKKILWKHQTQ